jgi:tetratricopeptide (TPR) repeat protein
MRKTSLVAAMLLLLAFAPPFLRAEARPAFLEPDSAYAGLAPSGVADSLATLEKMALVASGIASGVAESGRLSAYEARLGEIFSALRKETGQVSGSAAKAESILTFLHRDTLKAYREDATTVDGILDSGLYNCVSSAVLYALAAKSLGIETWGVRTSDHAFCSVLVDAKRIDVETTNPYGFDPGNKKEFKDSFGRATGYAYVAPGGYGDRRDIGMRELIGLILSNRASMLERSGRFAEAVKLGADYAALCPGDETRAFLVDRINNLIANYQQRRDYAGAEEAALAAASAFPDEPKLVALAHTASYNRAAAAAQSGDFEGAFDRATSLLDAAGASESNKADDLALSELARNSLLGIAEQAARKGDFEAARRAVASRADRAGRDATAAAYAEIGDMELVRAANGMTFAEAQATADRLLADGEVDSERYAQAIATIYGREASRLGKGGDFLGAAALAGSGTDKIDGATGDTAAKARAAAPRANLGRIAQAMRHNYAADAHNRFAALYNSGAYTAAEAVLNEALAALPGDPILEHDMATLDEAKKPRDQ